MSLLGGRRGWRGVSASFCRCLERCVCVSEGGFLVVGGDDAVGGLTPCVWEGRDD